MLKIQRCDSGGLAIATHQESVLTLPKGNYEV
jgi:hypothetical protein